MKKLIKYAAIIMMSALIMCLPVLAFNAKADSTSEETTEEDSTPSVTISLEEEAFKAMIAEGSKIERRTVSGYESVVPGLYFEKNVEGVGFYNLPGTKITDTKVRVYDADNKNNAYALAVARYVALIENGIVGPGIDVKFSTIDNQKGTPKEISFMSIGLPNDMKNSKAKYGVVAILPGGAFKYIPDTGILPDAVTIMFDDLKGYDTSSMFFAIMMKR